MRTKTVGRRKRSSTPCTSPSVAPIPHLSSTPQDKNHNAPLYDTDDDDHHHHQASPLPDFVPETVPLDSIEDTVCISCNEPEGSVLVCTETGCPVTVHVSCIGSEPKFDGSGNFYCPYCWYKRALNNARQLREKAVIAKKALSSFLEKEKTVRKEKPAEPVQDPVNQDELKVSDSEEGEERSDDNNDDKGKVSVTSSSVSETKDSESEAVSVKKKSHAKRKVASSVKKKSLVRERNGGGDDVEDEEEVTSSRTVRLQNQNQAKKHTSLTGGKRKRLLWTAEEEKALKEGVLKLSKENHNIPWRKILEFGCRVFDKTRTPADLKDKWKNITSKEGCK